MCDNDVGQAWIDSRCCTMHGSGWDALLHFLRAAAGGLDKPVELME